MPITVAGTEKEPIPGIYQKVFKLQAETKGIFKDAKNEHFKYKYASAENVLEAIKPTLQKLGILAIPQTKAAFSDGHMVVAETTLVLVDTEDGSMIEVSGIGEGSDNKQAMKANTSSLKYALLSAALAPMTDNPEADPKEDKSVYGAGGQEARTEMMGKLQEKALTAGVSEPTAAVAKEVGEITRTGKQPFKVTVDGVVYQSFDEALIKKIRPGKIVISKSTRFGNDLVEVN